MVTGASGLIGSAITARLISAGHNVRRGRRLCAQLGKLDFLHRETIDWYGLLALEQSPLARKVMGANRTSQRKKAPEAMMEAAERFHRGSIQSSWGFWPAFQKLAMCGRRTSERFGLNF